MKTKITLVITLSSLVLASCAREELKETPVSVKAVETSFEAGFEEPQTKLSLEGVKYSFEEGDEIFLLQYGNKSTTKGTVPSNENAKNIFTYSATDKKFTGSVKVPCVSSRWYVYSNANEITKWSVGGSTCTTTLNPVQTGKIEDLEKYLMYYTELTKASYRVVGKTEYNVSDAPTDMLEEITFKAGTFKHVNPIIKINVPSELGLKKIILTAADSKDRVLSLSGQYEMKASSSYVAKAGDADYVTIDRQGEVISGDTYFTILPEQSKANRYNLAAKLSFVFMKEDGAYAIFKGDLNSSNKLTAGSIYNFGSVPTTLSFSDTLKAANKPSEVKYLKVNTTDKTYTGKYEGTCTFAAGKESSDYRCGIEYSTDGGNSWTRVASTDLNDKGKFSVSIPDCSFYTEYKVRAYADLQILGNTSLPSDAITTKAIVGSHMIALSLAEFNEAFQTKATTTYVNEAFYQVPTGYKMVANGDLYGGSGGLYFNSTRKLSLPAPFGMKLTDALVYINSSQKNATIYDADGKTALASKTNKSSTASSASYDPEALRYYKLTPSATAENVAYLLGSTASGTYEVLIPSLILFYTPVGTQTTVDAFGDVTFSNTTTSASLQVTGSSASDFVYGFEKKNKGSWEKNPVTTGTLADGVLSFSVENVFEEGDTVRVYAYPAAGTYEANAQIGKAYVKPGVIVIYNFAEGCPFTKYGTEKNPGAYYATDEKLADNMVDKPRSGYDFPTGKQDCSTPKNVKETVPTVSNDGGCYWESSQWYTNYPLTLFNYNLDGTNYPVRIGSNIENKNAYCYYDTTQKRLVSNKVRIFFPNVPGYRVARILIDFTVSSYTNVQVYRYYYEAETIKSSRIRVDARHKEQKSGTIEFTEEDLKATTETDMVCFGSDNTPVISKITAYYKAVESKSSQSLSTEKVKIGAKYSY